jgi:hypothetical protein
MISRKFKNEISCKNYSHWIFTSNNENPIKIEDGDRRYSVFYSTKLKGGGKKASEFVQELEKNLDFELKEYISYLKSLKVEFWEVHEPIMTDAKLNILDLNKNTVDKFKEHLNTYNNLKNVFEVYNKENITYCTLTNSLGEETINTELVYLLYLAYCKRFNEKGIFNKNSFTRKLKINSEPVYNSSTSVSVRTYKIKDLIISCGECKKVTA